MINKNIISKSLEKVYNWVLPPKCTLCNNTDVFANGIFCSECFSKLTIVEEPICIKCGKLFTSGMPINALCNECSNNNNLLCNIESTFNNKEIYNETKKIYSTHNNTDEVANTKYNYNLYNVNDFIKDFNTLNNTSNICNNLKHQNNELKNKNYCNTNINIINTNNNRLFELARTLLLYDNFAKHIIMQIKVNADSNITNACCKIIFNKYPILFENIDYIVPVPSHWLRTLNRGFNPADIIARELSIISGIKVDRSLKRIKYTNYQHKKTKAERLKNLNEAFACNNNSLQNRNVLLVDDVFATGTTLNECTRALLQNGVTSVKCLTIASTSADCYYNKNNK